MKIDKGAHWLVEGIPTFFTANTGNYWEPNERDPKKGKNDPTYYSVIIVNERRVPTVIT